MLASTTVPKGEEADDLSLAAQIAAIAFGAFAILTFAFASVFGGASFRDVLLAELPSLQLRKGVYLAYGSLTASILFWITSVARRL